MTFAGGLDIPEAPFQYETSFSRQSITTGPDWRWQRARLENFQHRQGIVAPIDNDLGVMLAKRVQWLMDTPRTNLWFDVKWRPISDMVKMALEPKYTHLRKAVDIAVIRGYKGQQFIHAVPFMQPEIAELYKSWFFDLSGVQAIHAWMEDHVFTPLARKKGSAGAVNKLMAAYYGSKEIDLTSRVTTSDEARLMFNLLNNERMQAVAEYIMGDTKLPVETYAALMESAYTDLKERQKEAETRDGGGGVLDPELARRLTEVTSLMDPEDMEKKSLTDNGIEADYEMTYIRERWGQPQADKPGEQQQ